MSVSGLLPSVAAGAPQQRWASLDQHLGLRGLQLRVLEPEDRQQLVALFELLSPQSRYQRYFSPLPSLSDRVIGLLAGIDHHRHEAVGVFDGGVLVGAAHYVVDDGSQPSAAEVSVEVADHRQGQGIGTHLLDTLARLAMGRGIAGFTAVTLRDNVAARRLIKRLGWAVTAVGNGTEVSYTGQLVQP